jgi:myo-inositol 2-dehydrogenase / D-chiro-inositol 1-dehydrogenase
MGFTKFFTEQKPLQQQQEAKISIVDAAGNQLFAAEGSETSPYVQEHINLVTCIRQNIPFNEAEADSRIEYGCHNGPCFCLYRKRSDLR